MCWLDKLFGVSGVERPSPGDWVKEDAIAKWAESIAWQDLNVVLSQKPKLWIPMIPDTNSMDGVFDYGNNNILIAGTNEDDHKKIIDFIKVGDIAVYRTPDIYAIHRVVKIGNDAQGKYFKFKGDNNTIEDAGLIRENQIEWVSVGVIY